MANKYDVLSGLRKQKLIFLVTYLDCIGIFIVVKRGTGGHGQTGVGRAKKEKKEKKRVSEKRDD